MSNRRAEFKKWLINEIRSSSKSSYREIIDYMARLEVTNEFERYYQKWIKSHVVKNKKYNGPKSMSEILAGMRK